MSRGRLLALVTVLAAVVAAVAVRVAGPGTATARRPAAPAATADPGSGGSARLAELRRAAALAPCPASVSPELPDLVLPCLGGGPAVHLRGPASGTPLLLNVYGSWCAPCQDEMPLLVGFARRAAGRVALLGVDTEDDPTQALPFSHDFGAHWPAVQDDGKQFLPHYAPGPPVTLLIDGAGHVRGRHVGAFTSAAALDAEVRRTLGIAL